MSSNSTGRRFPAIIVMGVCGTGKSLIGKRLKRALTPSIFLEGDEFHSKENVALMESGTPLTDENRKGWLILLGQAIEKERSTKICITSCSALKLKYRKALLEQSPEIIFIHMQGSPELIQARMESREHYMPTSLLESQLAILEVPDASTEQTVSCDIAQSPDEIIQQLLNKQLPSLLPNFKTLMRTENAK